MVKIKTFIVDKDAAEIAAIKAVFPDTNIILCRFHVSNNFKDANSKYSKNCSAQDKENNLKALNRMLTTTVEATFYKSLNTLTSELQIYIRKNWLPILDSWARHKAKHILTYGGMTNNICERHNRELKTMCNTNTTLPEFLNKIIYYHKNQDQLRIQKIANLKLRSKKHMCSRNSRCGCERLTTIDAPDNK